MTRTKMPSPPTHPSTQKETTPLPPPFHNIPNLPNFRDIGGYPIIPPPSTPSSPSPKPRHVRRSIIYRGSDTTRITPAGEAKLREMGIVRDYDLRSKAQIERMGGAKEMKGIERVFVPLFEDADGKEDEETKKRYELYAGDGTEGIVKVFLTILLSSRETYRAILLPLISSPAPAPIFIHCTTGNNRTGALIAVLLSLLHVPAPIIAREYALSNTGMAATRHLNVERLLAKGAFAGVNGEVDEAERRRKCERMLSAREESVLELFREVERRWGGAEGFFREVVGLTGEEVEEVRRALTVEGDGEGA